MLDVYILGTSASIPTRNRNLPAILLNFKGERILFDCGEGTQKTLMSESLGLMRIDKIFITHWHADHWAGLIGLIQTMSMEKRKTPLYVYGPPRTEEFMEKLLSIGYYSRRYEIVVQDLRENEKIAEEIKGSKYEVIPFETIHEIPSLGYVFQEQGSLKANREKMKKLGLKSSPLIKKLKNGESIEYKGKKIEPKDVIDSVSGRKVVYTGDTRYSENIVKYSQNADLLIHDVTFSEELVSKGKFAHSCAREAAETAKKAKVKQLVLTHISRRYGKNPGVILNEARDVFKNTVVAEDKMHIQIKPYRPEK